MRTLDELTKILERDTSEIEELSVEEFARQLSDVFAEAAVPKDPVERAKQRMDDAARRGGLNKMIQATMSRIKASKKPEKLQGIVDFVDQLMSELKKVKRAAEAKL